MVKRWGYPTFRRRERRQPGWSESLRAELGLEEPLDTARIGPCWLNHAPIDGPDLHMAMDCDEARRLRVRVLLGAISRKEPTDGIQS